MCLISNDLQGLVADIKVLVANPVRPEFLAAGTDSTLQTWDLTSHELKGGCFPALADCGCSTATSVCPEAPLLPCKHAQRQLQAQPAWRQSAGAFASGAPRLPRHQAPRPVHPAATSSPLIEQRCKQRWTSPQLPIPQKGMGIMTGAATSCCCLQSWGAARTPLASDASSSPRPTKHSPNHHHSLEWP